MSDTPKVDRYAEVVDGEVTNVVMADEVWASDNGLIGPIDNQGIGWKYDGKVWTPPPDPEPTATDDLRQQLHDAKSLGDVKQVVAGLIDALPAD